jgi:nucleotide-binding universal stress UspA family protein
MTNHSPHKLLLAVDGSVHADRAAQYLARYATALDLSQTVVLYVQPAETFPTHAPDGSEVLVELSDIGMNATRSVRHILAAANLQYRVDTELGEPAVVIARAAQVEGVDEVVMGSRGMGQWKGLVLGSVAYKVIHRVPVPVTVVGTLPQEGKEVPVGPDDVCRILLAVDGSKPAANAVDYVCNLRRAGVPLEVELLTVLLPVPASTAANPEMADLYYREEGERPLRAAREALQSAAVKFTDQSVAGHAAEKIVQVADERRCTRIVMGTRGLGAMAGLILGSVAYNVIHLSRIPVTVVK